MIRIVCTFFLIVQFTVAQSLGQPQKQTRSDGAVSMAAMTGGMKKYDGFIPFYWDEKKGKIWLEIEKFDSDFLYYYALQSGIGSNDLGFDRGRLGRTAIVKFVRIGPKVLLIQKNDDYVARVNDPYEKLVTEESFAKSVLAGFEISAESNGHVLVDASNFILQDVYHLSESLQNQKQGTYKIDLSRSAVYLPATKNFPKNTEFEALITLTGEPKGTLIKEVVPSPEAVTTRQHHSFVELPDADFKPRLYDTRSGYSNSTSFIDFAVPFHEHFRKRYIERHRLVKKNPGEGLSEVVKPIVYYVDRGIPEPIRTAVVEGASWWAQAFEAAGFKNSYEVKLLPEGADPMDIRYNMIQWVHRSTRGWSYGYSVHDPRTGEILKGKVTLGSLRIRQDYLIAEGLVANYDSTGQSNSREMQEMGLARIRQLAAHEVGHTLGLAHNHSASINDRASVMEYPHPLVKLDNNGKIDISDAYAVGMGAWDKVAIDWGYHEYADSASEKKGLNKIISDAIGKGLLYTNDQDARPVNGAHPQSHQWDNGKDPIAELLRVSKVRETGLKRFSEKNIRIGEPMATLEEVLVPLYFFHRYQVHAVYKYLGGLKYTFALRGDGQVPTEMVPGKLQREALDALLLTIQPSYLAISENIFKLIPPRPNGFEIYRGREKEIFPRKTGMTFDPLTAAQAGANLTLLGIFNGDRISRIIEYSARDKGQPKFGEIIDKVINATYKNPAAGSPFEAEVQRIINTTVLAHLIKAATDDKITPQGNAVAMLKLDELKQWAIARSGTEKDSEMKAHYYYTISKISQLQLDPASVKLTEIQEAPPGAPIGSTEETYLISDCQDF